MTSRMLAAVSLLSLALLGCSSSGSKNPAPSSDATPVLDETRSSVAVTPNGTVIADGTQAAMVKVTLLDTKGAPLSGVKVDLEILPAATSFASGQTDANGVFAAPFTSTVAGVYAVQATAQLPSGPTPLNQRPSLEMVAGPAAALAFTGVPTLATAGGYLTPMEVSVVDAHGNVLASDTRTVTVEDANGSQDLLGTLTQSAAGGKAHFGDLALTHVGTYQLRARADGLPAATSTPFPIFAGAPSQLTSTFNVSATTAVADGVSSISFSAQLVDGYGNPCPQVLVRADVSGQANALDPAGPWVMTDSDGRVNETVTSTYAEPKTVMFLAPGIAFSSDVLFQPGPPDPAHSSMSIAPSSQVADGKTPAVIALTIRDAFENPIPHATYSVSASGTANVLSPSIGTTDAEGNANISLTSTLAEVKTVTSPAVSASQQVTFVPGTPAKLVILSSPSTAAAGDTLALSQVKLVDANDNLETAATGSVSVALNGTPAATLTGSLSAQLVNGIANFGNLSVDRASTQLRLVFHESGLSVTSTPFDVNAWRLLGPWGGEIRQIAGLAWTNPPGNTFVGTAAGVYESPDLGSSWSALTSGMGAPAITALAYAAYIGSTEYEAIAATEGKGVFVKPIGLAGWVPLNTGLGTVSVRQFAAISPTMTLAATSNGVFVNSGSGWTAANTGLSDLDVRTMTASFPPLSTYFLGTGSGHVFRSTDGVNWTEATAPLAGPVTALKVCGGSTPGILYAGIEGGALFTSTDGGASWQQSALASTDIRNFSCGNAATGEVAVVVTGDDGQWLDVSGAFSRFGSPPPSLHGRALGVYQQSYLSNSATFFLATDSGLYSSTSTSGTFSPWAGADTGISASTARALAVDPTNPATLYAGTSLGLYKSTDRGLTWAAANRGLTSLQVSGLAVSPTDPNTLYAVSADQGAFKSTDGAATWTSVNTGLTSSDLVAVVVDPVNPSTVYAASATGGIFKSTDAAASWSPSSAGLTTLAVTSIWIDSGASTGLFASTAGGGVFASTDQGASWAPVNSGLASLNTTVVTRAGGVLYAGTTEGRMFASADGSTWNEIGAASDAVQALVGDPSGATLFAATPTGVLRSDDQGATWSAVMSGMVDPNALTLAMAPTVPSTLFVGTNHSGVLRTLSGGR